MGLRRGYVAVAGLLGAAVGIVPAVASSETPSVEAVNTGLYGHAWSPAQATVAVGGSLAIRNPTATPHGVEWHSGPEAPVCSGVPVGTSPTASGSNWSGSCTFSKPGTYVFYCTVHGPEMTETITVGAGETTPTTQPTTQPTTTAPTATTPTTTTPAPQKEAPLAGPPSLRLARRGTVLRGALRVARSGEGGRLEVDVFARADALGRGHARRAGVGRLVRSAAAAGGLSFAAPAGGASFAVPLDARRVRVGRLVRAAVAAGSLSFAVPLDAPARRALARGRRLVLSVRIALTPPGGAPLIVKRTVADHA